MAVHLLSYEVSDLCLGKPPLNPLPISATVADALTAIKSSDYQFISVWTTAAGNAVHDRCIGKVSMVDIIFYLCKDNNLESPSSALNSPVSVLLSDVPGLVTHVEASLSLMDAIDLILQGTQNLVVPIKTSSRRKLQKPLFCWLTEEDIIRFLLNSIGLFSPTPTISIDRLGIINPNFLSIDYHSLSSTSIEAFSQSLSRQQTSVAVIDGDGILIGEISPFILACSTGDLMDCGGPTEELVKIMRSRLKDRKLEEFVICSETDNNGYSVRMVRSAEAIVCHPWSSLVAVMIQAIAHRVNYVWVIEEDYSLVGIVTFSSILGVFHEDLQSMV
ncbi:CBS domain-containing protein CBSX5-like [Impatiens glandulifera]|uniref:CBS domain-containing protein CBSX5-like n=1 Tax=Impatiens glandulifera TaxID=253017 RepID=UPI001FB09074|nr:CBS domain-containing protein CBSX5-like [Impatiens glandulifera]